LKEVKLTPNENYQSQTSVAPVVRVYKLGAEPKENSYWLSRPPLERLAMIERLRREFYGQEYELQQRPETLSKITVRKLR
jgi:hypothetical protein